MAEIRSDLDVIEDLVRWAHTDGYTPAGAVLDRVSGRAPRDVIGREMADVDEAGTPIERTAPVVGLGPDHVGGPLHDLGVGSHRARQAFGRSVPPLVKADRCLAVAVAACGVSSQPAAVQVGTGDVGALVGGLLPVMRVRLGLVTADAPAVRRALGAARREVDGSFRVLRAALERGAADPENHAVGDLCRVCGVRPTAEREFRRPVSYVQAVADPQRNGAAQVVGRGSPDRYRDVRSLRSRLARARRGEGPENGGFSDG